MCELSNKREEVMEIQEFGVAIGRGIIRELGNYVLIFLVLSICLSAARNYFGWGVDDSDKSGSERSGLAVKTDHKTGVQYLSDGKGGLFVRMDAKGNPILKK
jgi:hypothetical protein